MGSCGLRHVLGGRGRLNLQVRRMNRTPTLPRRNRADLSPIIAIALSALVPLACIGFGMALGFWWAR
jgi:hypothetical protein